jgi:Abortive infection C-terminus
LVQETAVSESIRKAIETIDSEYVTKLWRKIVERLNDDPEGAITAARNLVESVCKHILDGSDVSYEDKEDLPKLYSMTSGHLGLAPSQQTEQVFKKILGSCATVVQELATMRNKLGDAHGKGKRGVKPARRHAELAANLAVSVAVFLIATWEARRN